MSSCWSNKLGLTGDLNDTDRDGAGFNFAFIADGKYARYANSKSKYGGEAILFQNSGIKVYHYGDEEDQIIFYGPDVDTKNMVEMRETMAGDWVVISQKSNVKNPFRGTFEQCVEWVKNNWQQYRRIIFK